MEKNYPSAKGSAKRIGVIGPESTGKTSLCEALAIHYHTVWVPEYSREYIPRLNQPYTLNDIEDISKKQLEMEAAAIDKAERYLFADTELIVAMVWCLDSFNKVPAWMVKKIMDTKYDLYLLTLPDLPWIKDPVRENGHRREYFFNWYREELDKRNLPYSIIGESGISRLNNSIDAINSFFKAARVTV
jgi:NadR type nicotinamide-nucleotide adenylyltransferase